jgi:hypothetical protein
MVTLNVIPFLELADKVLWSNLRERAIWGQKEPGGRQRQMSSERILSRRQRLSSARACVPPVCRGRGEQRREWTNLSVDGNRLSEDVV